jgi:hypothetical protein
MLFLSNFFNFSANLQKLEKQAQDVFQLPNNLKAFRINDDIIIVNCLNSKIIKKMKDTLPSNPIRATLELIKNLKLTSEIKNDSIQKRSDVWTCGFRDDESRWVWYLNSEPKMTVSFNEAYKNGSLEEEVFFCSARYGTSIIKEIKETNLDKVSNRLNALVLKVPYVKISCQNCSTQENYTIDDLVDQNKKPNYNSNHVVCQNCNELVRLI